MLDRKGNSYSNDAYGGCPAPYSPEYLQRVLRSDEEEAMKACQPVQEPHQPTFESLSIDQVEEVRFDDVPTAPLGSDSSFSRRRSDQENASSKNQRTSSSSSKGMTGLTASHLQAPSTATPPPYNPEFIRRVSVDDPGLQSGWLERSSSSLGTAANSSDLHRESGVQIAMFKARRGMRALGKKVKDFDEEHHVVEKSKAAAVTAFRATKNGTVRGYQHFRKQINERLRESSSSSNKD